jgi:hypothetical protein
MGGMKYTPAQRKQISADVAEKTIASLEYDDDPAARYWTMTFTDGSEMSFRFMAELI